MKLSKSIVVTLLAASAVFAGAVSAAPANLDELLEQTRTARAKEEAANKEREAKFLAERNKQAALLSEVRTEVQEQQRRSASLSSSGSSSSTASGSSSRRSPSGW